MIVKIDLAGEKEVEFQKLKKHLGVSANTEVVHLALKSCYDRYLNALGEKGGV